MGIRTRTRLVQGTLTGVTTANSFNDMLKADFLASTVFNQDISKAVFMREREYSNVVENLSGNDTNIGINKQKEIIQQLKEGIDGIDRFHDELNSYTILLTKLQTKFSTNTKYNVPEKILTDKKEIEEKILQHCAEYLDGGNAIENLATFGCYDVEPVLERYTDFDNIKTVVEAVDDKIKFNNSGIITLLNDANQKMITARDLLKKYLGMSETALNSKEVHYSPINEIGYHDKVDDRTYVNIDYILEKLNITSISALMKLRENNHVKKEFYDLVSQTIKNAN